MARIRTIKPEFFLHERLASLSPLHRLLFAGLWTIADKEGRLEDRPKRIKASVLPYDECDVDAMLSDLEDPEIGAIRRYEAVGKLCIDIPSWPLHQRPHPKEAPSVLPPHPGERAPPPAGKRTPENGSVSKSPDSFSNEKVRAGTDLSTERTSGRSLRKESQEGKESLFLPLPVHGTETLAKVVPIRAALQQKQEEEVLQVGRAIEEASGTPFWVWLEKARTEHGLNLEPEPADFNDWVWRAIAEVGIRALSGSYGRFLLDKDFELRGWPVRVWMKDAVWRPRAFDSVRER